MRGFIVGLLLLVSVSGCPRGRPAAPREEARQVLSIIGTNDLHGQIDRLPIFAGFLANLRAARSADGGVLLVDAGDLFQGTLESNLNEGAAVIAIYNALGYAAGTIGNHEFDFGPVGEAAVVEAPGQDPRGALKARLAEANFPFVIANLVDADRRTRIDWPNTAASVLREVAGVKVGLIGVTTRDVPQTTMPANFAGLAVETPLSAVIAREATALRQRGAMAIVVLAHAGARCDAFDDPEDLSSCTLDDELFRVARDLPPGAVDVLVGGHSHQTIAHQMNGIAIIESRSSGRSFGRVDLVVDVLAGKVVDRRIFPPHPMCASDDPAKACVPGDYEGAAVVADPEVAALTVAPREQARTLREASLGVVVTAPVVRSRSDESALGNLFVDLMRAAWPECDVALTNGGALRADLPTGELTYGRFYQAMPFDNRFATLRMSGRQLRQLMTANLGDSGGIFSLSGIRVVARCGVHGAELALVRDDGTAVADDAELVVLTSDFLASGGDGAIAALELPASAIVLDSGPTIRDAMADQLRRRGGTLSGSDPALLDPLQRRVDYPGSRPFTCE